MGPAYVRPPTRSPATTLLAASALVVTALFLWQGHRGFSLWDEGFLWYGARGVLAGDVPIRDFMAYDPGRYYWSAAFMGLAGDDGIIVLRVAAAVFQALGLFVALRLVVPTTPSFPARLAFLALAAATLAAWMLPRHKLFDVSLSILLTGALTALLAAPAPKRWFVAGACIGIAAVFGRNHGVYGVAGLLGVSAWLAFGPDSTPRVLSGLAAAAGGLVAGYAPLVLWVALVPGLSDAFMDSIRFILELGATNIPLPLPWPWLVSFRKLPAGEAARQVLVGLFFLALPIFPVLALAAALARRRRREPVLPVVVASAIMGIPYAHYAYSRADIGHLALGIFPLLIGVLALLANRPPRVRWPLALLLAAATIYTVHPVHPGWHCRDAGACVDVEVSGSRLRVDPDTANNIAILRDIARDHAPGGSTMLVTPFWPGAYPLLGRRSPVWEIYALVPRSAAFEQQEIDRLQTARPSAALVLDLPLDGRDDLRFRNTHPRLHAYIEEHFERLPATSNPALRAYRSATPARF